MRKKPFHSKKNPKKFHMCSKCTEGDNIEPENLAQGKGKGELCAHCEKLLREGGC